MPSLWKTKRSRDTGVRHLIVWLNMMHHNAGRSSGCPFEKEEERTYDEKAVMRERRASGTTRDYGTWKVIPVVRRAFRKRKRWSSSATTKSSLLRR